MSNGIIARLIPRPASAYVGTIGYNGINPAFPAGNLADPQPKTVCQSNTGAANIGLVIDIDYGANILMDGVVAIGTNVSTAAGTWAAYATADGTAMPALGSEAAGGHALSFAGLGTFGAASTARGLVRHGLAIGTAVSRRYLRVYLADQLANNPDGVVRAGIISAVKTVPLAWNYELGSGRKSEDQSVTRLLPGGETAIERGGRTPVWRATWSNISDAEMRDLWALLLEIGTGAPLIMCEDPDATTGLNERIHYGLLTSLDFTERVMAEKQRIDLVIREMI